MLQFEQKKREKTLFRKLNLDERKDGEICTNMTLKHKLCTERAGGE